MIVIANIRDPLQSTLSNTMMSLDAKPAVTDNNSSALRAAAGSRAAGRSCRAAALPGRSDEDLVCWLDMSTRYAERLR